MTKFFISKNDQQMGPYSCAQIQQMLDTEELRLNDFYFCDQKDDWVPLFEMPQIVDSYLNKMKAPKQKPQIETKTTSQETVREKLIETNNNIDNKDWYVLKNNKKFGPYNYIDLIQMMMDQILFEYDCVWYSGLDNWKELSEFNEFTYKAIVKNIPQLSEQAELLEKRRSKARKKFHSKVIAHDNTSAWKAHSLDINSNGCSLVIENSMLNEGSELTLHFSGDKNTKAFNVKGRITNKNIKEKAHSDHSPTRYGVEFIEANKMAQEVLKKIA